MKIKHFGAAFVIAGLTSVNTSCSGGDQPQQPAQEDSVAVSPEDEPAEEVDASFNYKKESVERKFKTITSTITVDFATEGNEQLVNAINEYINKELGGRYKSDLKDVKEMLNFYANVYLDELKHDWEEGASCSREKRVLFNNETNNFISYTSFFYSYSGGTHGTSGEDGATFRKSDGKQLNWDMFNANNNEFKQLIKEGVKAYFEENSKEKIKNDDALKELLLNVEDVNNIPLPTSAPYFSNKGLVIHYGQYEIACYAMGEPEVVIPFATAKKFIKEPGFLY